MKLATRMYILLGLLLLITVPPCFAQQRVPVGAGIHRGVKYAGGVLDLRGRPQTGVAGVTFSLYKDRTGGVALWTETQNVLLDEHGRYRVNLHVDEETVRSGGACWLGVQVAGQQEQPRTLFTSVVAQQQPEFPRVPLYGVANPMAAVLADFNADGTSDLAIAVGPSDIALGVAVLLGNPDGSFHSPKYYTCATRVTEFTSSVATGDFNGDRHLDIVGANSDGSFCILLGNGDGTFQSASIQQLGNKLSGVGVGDFNNDGKLDLAITDSANNNVSILLGDGSGRFSLVSSYGVGWQPVSLAVADINGDRNLDILIANGDAYITILLGKGDGTFLSGGFPAAGGPQSSIIVADLNGDGKADIAATIPSGNRVSVLSGNGDGSFQPTVRYPAGSAPFFVTAGDVNHDGRPDLAVVSATGTGVLLNTGNGIFGPFVAYAADMFPRSVVIHDFDGDGRTDLAVLCGGGVDDGAGGNSVAVLRGNGDGSFLASVNYTVGKNPVAATIADFNLDGKPDIAVATEDGVSVLLGKNGGLFDAPMNYGKGASLIAAADLNGDGKPDLITLTGSGIGVLLGNGGGTFDAEMDYALNTFSFALGDFNGDGKLDVAAVNGSGVAVLVGNGDGTLRQPVTTPAAGPNNLVPTQPIVAAADLNRDGKLDLVFIGSSGVTVLLGNGNGTFSVGATYGAGGYSSIAVADVNGDGVQDLIVGDFYSTAVIVLIGNGDGTFKNQVTYDSGVTASVATADFNGDGVLDLGVAVNCLYETGCQFGGTVGIMSGKGDGTFTQRGAYSTGSWPLWLSISDLNLDGAPDIVAVNNLVPNANGTSITVLPNLGGTFTNLSSSPNPSQAGQTVTLSATVVGSITPAIRPTPSGIVTFKDGNSVLGTVSLRSMSAVLKIASLNPGVHSLSAFYSGDSNFNPHGSRVLAQTVQQQTTTTTLISNANPSMSGSPVTFTARVTTTGSGQVTGSVTFKDGSTSLKTATLNAAGITAYTTSSLSIGQHSITAVYGGDISNAASVSAVLVQTVNQQGVIQNASFVPVTPCRVADTRLPAGPFGGPAIAGQTSRDFVIPNSACGIPTTAVAFSLNVTVVPHGPLGFLTVWPSGQSQPWVSTLNSDGRVKANAAIIPAGSNQAISVFATNTTDLVLDINGYFVATSDLSALAFYPLTPCRVVDTRLPNGPLGGPYLNRGQNRYFPLLTSSCGIPGTAQAFSLNFTAVPKGPLGFLTVWPSDHPRPFVSTLNSAGATTANAAIVPSASDGSIGVFATDNTDLVIDVNGYFAPASSAPNPLSLHILAPCRVLDTRTKAGMFNGTLPVSVAGSCSVPGTAQAFVLNATVVPPGFMGFLTLWPHGGTPPTVSTLNAWDGSVTSNMAIVPANSGWIDAFAMNQTHLVLDINSYFAPPNSP